MSFPGFFSPFMRRILVAGLGLALAACALQQQRQAAPAAAPAAAQQTVADSAAAKANAADSAPVAAAEVILPKQDLTEEVLYEYLLAEIAGQRGSLGLSAQAYADLAKHTRDPRIAKRAAEVALYARMPSAAIDAAKIWYETEPSSMQALQTLTSLLINTKRHDEALPY